MTQAAENEQLRAGMADMAQGMDEFKKEMEEAGAGAAAEAAAKAQEDIDALRKQLEEERAQVVPPPREVLVPLTTRLGQSERPAHVRHCLHGARTIFGASQEQPQIGVRIRKVGLRG